MPEPPVQAVEPPVVPVVEPPKPTSYISEDGTFTEGWREKYVPEEIRGEKVFDRVTTIQGAFKSLASAEKMVGLDKVAVPNEASSDEVHDAFHRAGGRPDTAADYNYVKPEDFPEELWDNEFATQVQEILFKGGASKQLAEKLFNLNLETVLNATKARTEADERDFKDAESALYRDWGNAYEQNKHLGNVAIEKGSNGDAEFKERIVQKFGNDPDFIRYSSNLGSKFAEHGIPIPGVPTPGDLQKQISEESAKKSYGADYVKHGFTKEQHRSQVELVSRLYREKAESTKTG